LPTPTRDGKRELGLRGEELACAYLVDQGYSIVDRNWRSRTGEIDVVARTGRVTVFVEVKTRRTRSFGEPEESVTRAKAGRLRKLAGEYLSIHGGTVEVRFDVLSILFDGRNELVELRHIPDAF
jgi:putative endonuclease